MKNPAAKDRIRQAIVDAVADKPINKFGYRWTTSEEIAKHYGASIGTTRNTLSKYGPRKGTLYWRNYLLGSSEKGYCVFQVFD